MKTKKEYILHKQILNKLTAENVMHFNEDIFKIITSTTMTNSKKMLLKPRIVWQ